MALDTGVLLYVKDVNPIAFDGNYAYIELITGMIGKQYQLSSVSTDRFLIPAIFKYGVSGDVKHSGSLIL